MLRAEREGITSEQLIDAVRAEHMGDFADFLVDFDNYHSTHSEEPRAVQRDLPETARRRAHRHPPGDPVLRPGKADVPRRPLHQGHLPEVRHRRPVRRQLRACGATYAPTELKDPKSAISGATPVLKESLHYFFKLPDFEAMLKQWTRSGALQESVANKLAEWLDSGLQQWDISRDAPYFGFEIPDAPGKYFYVWLDAPIGYMASFKNLCARRPELDFDAFWGRDSSAELYHFIGKDIVNFHALFWPAMLEGAGYRKPTALNVHGYLTVNGQKMSKSRGTFVKGAHLPRPPGPGIPALLLRLQARPRRRGPRPEPRGLRAEGQLRPGRQGRQHRQPLRRLHPQGQRRRAGRRRSCAGAARRLPRGRTGHRRGL